MIPYDALFTMYVKHRVVSFDYLEGYLYLCDYIMFDVYHKVVMYFLL